MSVHNCQSRKTFPQTHMASNPGGESMRFLPKFWRLWNFLGGFPPFLSFIAFLLTSDVKILERGSTVIHPHNPCVHLCIFWPYFIKVGLPLWLLQYMPEIWTLLLQPFIFHRHLQVIILSSLLFLSATLKLIGSSISTMLKTSLKQA